MTSSTEAVAWPAWSPTRPADLARYVLPNVVARHAAIPGPSPATTLVRLDAVWQALREVGVSYAFPRPAAEAGQQYVRSPAEVLVAPRSGTCLDLALVLAGACVHAGLECAVVTLEPVAPGSPGHAVVAVLLEGTWPARATTTGTGATPPGSPSAFESLPQEVWLQPPVGLVEEVQTELSGPPRALVVLDPNQMALQRPAAMTKTNDESLAAAVRAGHAQLTSPAYRWGAGTVVTAAMRHFRPAPTPKVLPLRQPYLDPAGEASALRLVRPEYRLTPFQARDETSVLHDFCDRVRQGASTGIAVVTGVGGSGKTRLALQVAERLQSQGWYAGALRLEVDAADPASTAWLAEVTAPLCVVVDYADGRIAETRQLLQVLRARSGPPAAVILSARSAEGDWLEQITGAAVADGQSTAVEHVSLPDAHPEPSDVFARTWHALTNDRDGASTDSLSVVASDPSRWTTLDLVLLGWLAAQGGTGSTSELALPRSRADLYEEVLEHERRYWLTTHKDRTGQTGHLSILVRAAAVLTLTAPPADQAVKALKVLPELADDARWRFDVAETMRTCLAAPPLEGLALRPDPVGDHHLLNVAAIEPKLIQAALGAATSAAELHQRLNVVNRAGGHPSAPDPRAVAILRAFTHAKLHPDTTAEERMPAWKHLVALGDAQSGAAEKALIELVESGDRAVPLDELDQVIPTTALGLWRLGLVTTERRLHQSRTAGMDPARLASLLGTISERRRHAGDRAGALAAIDEVVRLRRQLSAVDQPASTTSDLATALDTQSHRRSEAGDRAGALAASDESVTLLIRLAAADPATFTPRLAGSLNNQAARRWATGDRTGALAASDRSVKLFLKLAAADPDAFASDLAGVLVTQSTLRSVTGDRAGALASIDESLKHFAKLALADPVAFTPDLAMALNTQSTLRSENGDRSGALNAIDEAVALYRKLATANPAAFTPELASGLNNQANRLSQSGERAKALAASKEAVGLFRELAAENPAAFDPDLAMALNGQANHMSARGDRAGALVAIDEAVALRRGLVAVDPTAFTPSLAGSLSNQAVLRSEVGDRSGALAAIDEAVRLYRALVVKNPAAFTPDLAATLNGQASRRSESGARAEALVAIDEAVRLYRALVVKNPAAFTPDLATVLNNQAALLLSSGDRAAAVVAIDETVAFRRHLVAEDPTAFTPSLAGALNNQSNLRSAVGDLAGALASSEEAVELYDALTAADPAAFTPDLAKALNGQCARRAEVGDKVGALASSDAAVGLYNELRAVDPDAFTPSLAQALNNQATLRSEVGDSPGALAAIDEAVELYHDLRATDPTPFAPDLAQALNNQATLRSQVGERVGALAASEEAVKMYRELHARDPVAFTPDLATALNNQANRRSESEDSPGALAAIDEAVRLYSELAEADPDAFLPDLAMALNGQANRRSESGDPYGALAAIDDAVRLHRQLATHHSVHIDGLLRSTKVAANLRAINDPPSADSEWNASLAAVDQPTSRGRVHCAYAGWLIARHELDAALEQLAVAAAQVGADEHTVANHHVTTTRHEIRQVASALRATEAQGLHRLPAWVTAPIPDWLFELLGDWIVSNTDTDRVGLLVRKPDLLSAPATQAAMDALVMLYPGNEALRAFSGVLEAIDDDGWEATLTALRRQAARSDRVAAWLATPDWTTSFAYLNSTPELLADADLPPQLASAGDPVSLQHAAILELARRYQIEHVRRIVTDAYVAQETGFDAAEAVDLYLLACLLDANPVASTGRGQFLVALLLSAAGRTDHAVAVARQDPGLGETNGRRARLITLDKVIATTDDADSASALQRVRELYSQAGHGTNAGDYSN